MLLYSYHFNLCIILAALVCLVSLVNVNAQQDYSCSPDRPCKLGCCGKNNVCGMGPSYCAPENCTSTCDAKSECDPGWGWQWSERSNCPLNVCCSEYGFCGTTEDFCGDEKVTKPSCPGGTSAGKKVIGYYEGWSTSKKCNGLNPEDLLIGAYTHLNYAFAFINPESYRIANMQDSDEEYMPRLTALKNYNPSLEVWIAIGGWSMNDPDQPTKRTFSELAASTDHQDVFFESLLSFMDKYGFDGVDIDWEYPVAEERSGAPEDFENFVSFLKNLKAVLGNRGLTITLPASFWYLQHFDIKNMEPILDWFNIMSYDLHGTWDGTNPYLGPYINSHTNLTEIDLALELLWRNDIDPKKVVMGMGFYGRSFTLSDPACNTPGCGFSAGGNPGKCSASAGSLMFSEIQDIIDAGGAEVVHDEKAGVQMVTWDTNQWVSYDDDETLKAKMDYANELCLGGVMVWAASTDDHKGTAIRALAKAAGRTDLTVPVLAAHANNDPSQCVWGECGADCPSGLIPVEESSSNKNPLGIELGCNQGTRYFCCPSKSPPTCKWKGSPKFCGLLAKNRCNDEEIEVSASTDGCWTGHKSLCCTKTESTDVLDACKWFGAAPICAAGAFFGSALGPLGGALSFESYGCGDDDRLPNELTKAKQGQGGQQSCSYNGGFKSFCCENPTPWKDCKWRAGNTAWVQWENLLFGPLGSLFFDFSTDCKTGCEPGETTVATDGWGCRSGTYSYFCCADPNQPASPELPDINLCYGPNHLDSLESELEEESNLPNVYDEEDEFDYSCGTDDLTALLRERRDIPVSNSSQSQLVAGLETSFLLAERDLFPRGARERVAMALCGPNGQRSSIWVQQYPGASSILLTTGRAWTVAKQGLCAAAGITGLSTLASGTDWVTEHVLEKQEFRNALEYMASGETPSHTPLTEGAVPFAQVFGPNGIFQHNWPTTTYTSLSFTHNWAGNINDYFTGLLGRTSDSGLSNRFIDNLQVCDRDFNVYKEYMVKGWDFISRNMWDNYNPQERIGILLDVVDMHNYRREDDVVKAFHSTFDNIAKLFGDLTTYAATQGVNYDFEKSWREIMPAYLNWQVDKVRQTFETYVDEEILFWAGSVAQNTYAPTVITSMDTLLRSLKTDINTNLALKVAQMTA
ncbi:glycoside hydrolase family 18 protein [Aspergillus mulundensis]|uniref:chitinase n=1 Tax=Aspergillus mulundensis TaxID=1810919 RepID=A0A3D8SCW3_9EURO|nr:hypothetical protein DSM5745_04327 [Aspergillus mulundensis]RDW84001.1 hypothetical protein DSM5745_04327 [Aspergillus mulundensis]